MRVFLSSRKQLIDQQKRSDNTEKSSVPIAVALKWGKGKGDGEGREGDERHARATRAGAVKSGKSRVGAVRRRVGKLRHRTH